MTLTVAGEPLLAYLLASVRIIAWLALVRLEPKLDDRSNGLLGTSTSTIDVVPEVALAPPTRIE